MSEEQKTPQDKPSIISFIMESQNTMQKELSALNSAVVSLKEDIKNNSVAIAEVKSYTAPTKEKKDSIEQLLKEVKALEGMIPELISATQGSQNVLTEMSSLMTSVSGSIRALPTIQAKIEESNMLISKIPEKYDKLVARIEKITDVMGMPESRSWLKSAIQQGINLGMVIMIILAAIGLYRIWLLVWPIFTN